MDARYLDAIKRFEGFTADAKWDYAQFSNGYGTRARFDGERITRAEAERRFQTEILEAAAVVERHAARLDAGTKAALTSLTFNAGPKWTRSGLGEAIRQGDLDTARTLFLQYDKADGRQLPGLAARRQAEAAWFAQPSGPGVGRSENVNPSNPAQQPSVSRGNQFAVDAAVSVHAVGTEPPLQAFERPTVFAAFERIAPSSVSGAGGSRHVMTADGVQGASVPEVFSRTLWDRHVRHLAALSGAELVATQRRLLAAKPDDPDHA